MTECDKFFASKATIFIGERAGAEEAAAKAAARLAGAGMAYETVLCLQHEHLLLYHRGTLYTTPVEEEVCVAGESFVRTYAAYTIDHFLESADWLRRQNPVTVPPQASPAMTAPTGGRIELRDHRHADETLAPLSGRRMRLATRDGRLAFGNWWLGSLDAGTFEVAGGFGLLPPACGHDRVREPYDHVILEVWPAGEDGKRLDCVDARPHTTMIHVPYGHDIALHLVGEDETAAPRNRTDENLRGVFG